MLIQIIFVADAERYPVADIGGWWHTPSVVRGLFNNSNLLKQAQSLTHQIGKSNQNPNYNDTA